jgi:hypothetical protein
MRKIVITAAALAALTLAGCASTGATHKAVTAAPATSAVPATPAAAPAAPNPDGTFQGSCDYSLNDNIDFSSNIEGKLLGEVELRNTGNIGTVERVRITWPQFGLPPVVRTRVVHVASGDSRTVQFHVPATSDMIGSLQDWQERHGFKDGCKYRATLVRTFGSVH